MGTDAANALDIYSQKQIINLEFHNITYQPKQKRKKETPKLLDNVSGKFIPGRLTGILGPSGAGKSSLLNVLSGFKKSGISGQILVNDEPMDRQKFRQNSAYISQDANMLPNITVVESLEFAADLKLPCTVSKASKSVIVGDIVKLLGLQKCANSMVVNLSGGEKKRLSIGVELVINPQVMFFDEPTSGLDSVSAAQVMRHLRDLALRGRTIICVIHQPTSSLLQLFDDLYILTNGKCVFKGSLEEMVPTFQKAGFDCPNFFNRADFALEIASLPHEGNICKLIESNYEALHDNGFIVDEKTKMLETSIDINANTSENTNEECRQYPITQWCQFVILTRRTILCTLRDFHLAKMRIVIHVFVAFLLGTVFWQVGNDAAKITSNSACLFFCLLFLFFANSMPVVLTFPLETGVLLREHLNNWYSLPAYFFSKLVADFPLLMLGPTLFVFISYYMTCQPNEGYRLGMLWFVCILTSWIAQLTGLLAGSAFCMELGVFSVPASAIPMLIFSGFFIRFRELFNFLKPLTYISYFRYGFEGSVQAIYGFGRPNMPCSDGFCYFKSINRFLEYIDMKENNFTMDLIGLAVWILVLHFLLYAALKIRLKKAQ